MKENLVYRISSYIKNTEIRNAYVYVKATSIEEAIEKFRKHSVFKDSNLLSVEYLSILIE